jgi:RimJ/RimL family protein N-acetyltransferase
MKTVVTLEPRTMAHARELFAVVAEPALYEFIEEDPPVSVEALRNKLSRSESRRSPDGSEHWLNWIVRDESAHIAGHVQATVAANLETNVAYVFGSAFGGRGIATEAVRQMIDIVAAEFGVTKFFIIAERRNVKSIDLARRLKFTESPPEVIARKHIVATDILMQKFL